MSLLIMSLPVIASYGWSLTVDVLLLYRLMMRVTLEFAPVMSKQCQCLCGSSVESVLTPTILSQHVSMPPLRGVAVESVFVSRLLLRASRIACVSVSERVVWCERILFVSNLEIRLSASSHRPVASEIRKPVSWKHQICGNSGRIFRVLTMKCSIALSPFRSTLIVRTRQLMPLTRLYLMVVFGPLYIGFGGSEVRISGLACCVSSSRVGSSSRW